MKTLEEIKNEFAIEISYNSWSEFKMINNRNIIKIERAMDEVAKRYAKEVAIASLEKASQKAMIKYSQDGKKDEFSKIFANQKEMFTICKSSITNEKNIII